jgi:hypothetical protein
MEKKIIIGLLAAIAVILGGVFFQLFSYNGPKIDVSSSTSTPEGTSTSTASTTPQTGSIASLYIYGPETNKAKVFLYAKNQITVPVTSSWCFANAGFSIYNGDYSLVLDPATAVSDNPAGISDFDWKESSVSLGRMQFSDTYTKMKNIIREPNEVTNMIAVYQYDSCNTSRVAIYGYDLAKASLVKYRFVKSDKSVADNVVVSNSQEIRLGDGDIFVASIYDQSSGETKDTSWQLDSSADVFREF